MRAGAVGRIALLPKDVGKSSLQVGDWVIGTMSWGEYAKVPLKELQKIQ
jgi:NADPH-dependent curcumin reductase CurA